MSPRVVVIGGGIIGLSTAVLAQEKIPNLDVTLISEKFSPHTTGDGAAGLWKPYYLKDTPQSDILCWASKTYSHMLKLWKSSEADEVGVTLVAKYELSARTDGDKPDIPVWSNVPVAYTILNKNQAQKLAANKKFTCGAHFITFVLEPSRYLPYLMKKFLQNGGKVMQYRVERMEDLIGQFDITVNCVGVQACYLVPDTSVKPVRGQVLRVKAPWIFQMVSETKENGNYIIPNIDHVVLGGTQQEDNWNTQPDPQDSKAIFQGCCELNPGLKGVEITSEWAGLRPSRPRVRLERDYVTDDHGNRMHVIHNYGHGGSGITLSYGCAHDAVELIQDILKNLSSSGKCKSKL